jgi:hypothetical protein
MRLSENMKLCSKSTRPFVGAFGSIIDLAKSRWTGTFQSYSGRINKVYAILVSRVRVSSPLAEQNKQLSPAEYIIMAIDFRDTK